MDETNIRRWGRTAWSLLGIIALAVAVAVGIGAISGIVVPLVIAVILGTLLDPVVGWLERRGLSPTLATVLSLLLAVVVGIGVVAIVIWGFLRQLPEISRQLVLGWESFLAWGRSLDLDAAFLERTRVMVQDYVPQVSQGLLGAVGTTFSGAVTFGIGTFFAVFFLFFVLRDARVFPAWFAARTHFPDRSVREVVAAAKGSVRGYFKGIGITALITAPVFMVPLLLLRVPLALPIFILYFFSSFIPFIGAWLTGAFAVLIAFSSGGASAALIVALSLLVSNGTIQSAVSSWALGSSLKIHPVAVLLATLLGGAVAGILGMVLGAPLVAAVKRSSAVLRGIAS